MPPKKRRPVGRAQLLALGLLGITVVGAPLLLGGVPAWARILIEVASWLSLVAAIWATRRSVRDAPPSAWLVMSLVLVGVTAVQVAPMPLSWLAWLAPESASAVRSTQQALGQGDASWGALSMDPGATLAALLQGLGLVSVAVAAWLLALAGRRRLVLWLLVASAGVMAFVALGHEATGADKVFGLYDPRFVHPHPLSPLLNLNHLSALLSVGAVLSLGLAAEQRGGRRVTTLVLSVTLVATTLLTASRGGVASLLGAVVLFAILVRFESRRDGATGRFGIGLVLGLGVGLGAYVALDPLLAQLTDTSLDSKAELVREGVLLALRHPWLGVGRGAFGSASSQVWGTLARGLYAENLPIHWAAEWGIPAALLGLTVLGGSVMGFFRRRRSPPRLAAGIALVMLFAHELVDFSLELAGVGTVAAVLLGATLGRSHGRAGRVGAKSLVMGLAAVSLVGLVALAPRATRVDSLAAQEALGEMLRAGDAARFHTRLVQAMTAHPQDAAFPLIGGAEAVGRDAREALPLLNRAMILAPGWASPHELTARWLSRHHRRDQALLELQQAAIRDTRLAAPLMCQILRASPDATWALRAAPAGTEGVPLLNRAARCMLRHPEVAEAIDQEILRRDEGTIEAQLRAIERLKRAGQMEAALDQAQDAHRAHATDADVTLALAQLLVDAQRPREALDLLRRAGGSLPDRAQMLRVEAGAHAGLGDAEAMRRSIGQLRGLAAARAGPLAAVLLLRARLELQLGNRAQALVALERAERLSPSQATLLQIARLAEQLGATARAQTAYRELLRDAPDNVNYQQAFVRTGGQLPIR